MRILSTKKDLNDFTKLPFHPWNMAPLTSSNDSGSSRNADLCNSIPAGSDDHASIPT